MSAQLTPIVAAVTAAVSECGNTDLWRCYLPDEWKMHFYANQTIDSQKMRICNMFGEREQIRDGYVHFLNIERSANGND